MNGVFCPEGLKPRKIENYNKRLTILRASSSCALLPPEKPLPPSVLHSLSTPAAPSPPPLRFPSAFVLSLLQIILHLNFLLPPSVVVQLRLRCHAYPPFLLLQLHDLRSHNLLPAIDISSSSVAQAPASSAIRASGLPNCLLHRPCAWRGCFIYSPHPPLFLHV